MALLALLCVLLVAGIAVVAVRRSSKPQRAPGLKNKQENVQEPPNPPSERLFDSAPSLPSLALDGGSSNPLDPDQGDSLTHVRPLPRAQDPRAVVSTDASGNQVVEIKPLVTVEVGAEGAPTEGPGEQDRIWTSAAAKTDKGMKRIRNEDAYFTEPDLGLYAIADGMGGYSKGDVASRLAVQEVARALREGAAETIKPGLEDVPPRGRELMTAIDRANAVVHGDATRAGVGIMGTTLLAVRFARREQRVYVAHVGDSRCYRLRAGTLKLLTTDHTHAILGETGKAASDLYRAVGVGPTVDVDLVIDQPKQGDIYLLCTDGLSRSVDEKEIQEILSKPMDLERINTLLVLAANRTGGPDNITVITIAVREPSALPRTAMSLRPQSSSDQV